MSGHRPPTQPGSRLQVPGTTQGRQSGTGPGNAGEAGSSGSSDPTARTSRPPGLQESGSTSDVVMESDTGGEGSGNPADVKTSESDLSSKSSGSGAPAPATASMESSSPSDLPPSNPTHVQDNPGQQLGDEGEAGGSREGSSTSDGSPSGWREKLSDSPEQPTQPRAGSLASLSSKTSSGYMASGECASQEEDSTRSMEDDPNDETLVAEDSQVAPDSQERLEGGRETLRRYVNNLLHLTAQHLPLLEGPANMRFYCLPGAENDSVTRRLINEINNPKVLRKTSYIMGRMQEGFQTDSDKDKPDEEDRRPRRRRRSSRGQRPAPTSSRPDQAPVPQPGPSSPAATSTSVEDLRRLRDRSSVSDRSASRAAEDRDSSRHPDRDPNRDPNRDFSRDFSRETAGEEKGEHAQMDVQEVPEGSMHDEAQAETAEAVPGPSAVPSSAASLQHLRNVLGLFTPDLLAAIDSPRPSMSKDVDVAASYNARTLLRHSREVAGSLYEDDEGPFETAYSLWVGNLASVLTTRRISLPFQEVWEILTSIPWTPFGRRFWNARYDLIRKDFPKDSSYFLAREMAAFIDLVICVGSLYKTGLEWSE